MARDRLARRIRADVADVRVRLEEAVLRTDALLASGQPERAAAVMDEQQALLAEFHDTLASSVAAAAVEAAAEEVLGASPDAERVLGGHEHHDAAVPARPVPSRPERPGRRTLRAATSALASAAAALAFMVTATTTPGPQTLAGADVDDRPTRGAGAVDDARDPSASSAHRGTDATERAIGPNELEIRRLFASPSTSTSPRDRTSLRLGSPLASLQSLVDGILATVVRAAGELAPAVGPAVEPVTPDLERILPARESWRDRSADAEERDSARSEPAPPAHEPPPSSSSDEPAAEERPSEEAGAGGGDAQGAGGDAQGADGDAQADDGDAQADDGSTEPPIDVPGQLQEAGVYGAE